MVNVTELRRTPVQLPGMMDLSEDQARRLQVRALVPGEELARLVPDVEGLAISPNNFSFFSFRHLPAKTTVELHFLRDSSAADLEILGDLVALETDDVPYEGRIATRYHYTVVFDRGTDRSVEYVLAALQDQPLPEVTPSDPTFVATGLRGWLYQLRRRVGREAQGGLVVQGFLVMAALAFFGLLDWAGTSFGLGWIAAALVALVISVPVVVVAVFYFIYRG